MSESSPKPNETISVGISPILLSAQVLAKRLGISLRTLWRLRSGGRLPEAVRLGGTVRWRTSDIDAWVAAGCPRIPSEDKAKPRIRG